MREHVGNDNQGTGCLSSLHYARQSNIPDGPFGASGRTKRREEGSVPPGGVSHRSYWSAANPFVLVLTDEQRVSATAARSCDVIQQKPSDHKVAFPQQNLHKAAL